MPEPDLEYVEDGMEQTKCADGGNRFQVLGFEQVHRLHRLMDTEVPIHGRGNFPTLHIKLKDLVQVVRQKLKKDDITVRDIRLNGGAASFILGNETSEVSRPPLSGMIRLGTHRNSKKLGRRHSRNDA